MAGLALGLPPRLAGPLPSALPRIGPRWSGASTWQAGGS